MKLAQIAFCHHCVGMVTAAAVGKSEVHMSPPPFFFFLLCSTSSKEVINLYVTLYRAEQTATKKKLSSQHFLPSANATVREADLF